MAASLNKVIEYFGVRASDYSIKSARGLWGYVRDLERRTALDFLAPQPAEKILDVGCGSGFYAEEIHRVFGASVYGLDPCPQMLERAKPFCRATYQTAIEDFFSDEAFPKILVAGSFEFVEDIDRAWQRVGAVAPVGAELTLIYPNVGWIGFLYRIVHAFTRCPVFLRKEERWINAARAAGFSLAKRARGPISSVFLLRKMG